MNHRLSHANGAPVVDNLNIETAGPRGPALLQDIWLIEKLAHFDREVIPERRMHAKGSGAYGTFKVTGDVTAYTKAGLFGAVGKETPVFVRFSTVAGERGAADAERDIRGFAVKFYTEDGNWDLVGNNTPVFFLRDPLRFPDLNHAVKRDPRTNLRSAQNNWDFWTLLPEALHQVTIVMSERGLPDGYRHMHGFGSHTFSFINAANERHWVKFTLKSQQGIRNFTDAEAAHVVAGDRESAQRDLYDAIQRHDFPKWTLYVQVLSEAAAQALPYNPFDLTKVWLHKDAPLLEVGELELNRNPDNYFAEVEQAAFSPANIVPGIGFSPDKMLQARLFSYGDAQRYRLGVNHHAIPVNAPRCPFHSYHRDGAMRVDDNAGGLPGIVPNSRGKWADHPELMPPALPIAGAADHWDHAVDDDYFTQPGLLFKLMTPSQRQCLFDNTARAIRGASAEVKQRHIANCTRADPAYGQGVAAAIEVLDAGRSQPVSTLTYPTGESALLLVDPYNDFLSPGGKLYEFAKDVIEATGTVAHMRDVLAAVRAAGLPVFYVPHHRAKPSDFFGWRHASPYLLAGHKAQVFEEGSWGGQWHPDFQPQPGDVIAREHWSSSGFANTDLDLQLRRHGIERVIVIGLLANTCIETTARYAAELGYHVTLVRNATAAFKPEAMHAAHAINGPTYAHEIADSAAVIAALIARPSGG